MPDKTLRLSSHPGQSQSFIRQTRRVSKLYAARPESLQVLTGSQHPQLLTPYFPTPYSHPSPNRHRRLNDLQKDKIHMWLWLLCRCGCCLHVFSHRTSVWSAAKAKPNFRKDFPMIVNRCNLAFSLCKKCENEQVCRIKL